MRFSLIAILFCFANTPASAQTNSAYRSLERIADVAARLEREFCEPGLDRIFQGALDGVNAMPARRGLPPLQMRRPGIEDFANTYSDLLESTDDDATIERAAINGMIAAIDPGGAFHPDRGAFDRYGNVFITLAGGPGIPFITEMHSDGPAGRAGIQPGDVLTAIDDIPVQGLRREDVARGLGGEAGSTVALTVERSGAPFTASMQRASIGDDEPTVQWRIVEGAGVITLTTFKEETSRLMREAIAGIRRETGQPTAYIIDLRDSPGGLLDQIIDVADQFITGGPIVTTRPVAACEIHSLQRYHGRRDNDTEGVRLIVLVNGGTSSGAEAVAAALRERRNATLIGQNTLGHASVHTVIPLNAGRDGLLRITTGTMHSPSDATWQRVGLAPDIITAARTPGVDPAMDRALSELRVTATR